IQACEWRTSPAPLWSISRDLQLTLTRLAHLTQIELTYGAMLEDASAGGVVWVTGLAGARKTTPARILRDKITERTAHRPVILDGDRPRRVLPGDYGYSRHDRQTLAESY